jgi:mono/diheme cytochrome c family protein
MRAMGVWAMLAAAAMAGPAAAADAEAGRETYERYCASCHGIEATGSGPMRPVLTVKPTDLTALSAGNEGVFPLARVVKRIDGRDPLVAHGSPMPVYGDFFEGEDVALKTPAGQPVLTSRPVADLVAYLEGLQDGQAD